MSISKSLHDSNKSVRLDKVGFVTDHSGGAVGGETTHPAVVSPAHDNTMTCDTGGKILMEFLVAPASQMEIQCRVSLSQMQKCVLET